MDEQTTIGKQATIEITTVLPSGSERGAVLEERVLSGACVVGGTACSGNANGGLQKPYASPQSASMNGESVYTIPSIKGLTYGCPTWADYDITLPWERGNAY